MFKMVKSAFKFRKSEEGDFFLQLVHAILYKMYYSKVYFSELILFVFIKGVLDLFDKKITFICYF